MEVARFTRWMRKFNRHPVVGHPLFQILGLIRPTLGLDKPLLLLHQGLVVLRPLSTPSTTSTLSTRARAKAKAEARALKSSSATTATGGGIGLKGARVAKGPREVEVHHVQSARVRDMGHHNARAKAVEHLFLLFLGQAGEKGTKAVRARAARIRDFPGGERDRVVKEFQHSTIPIGKVQMRAGAARQARGQ